ncbi:hypothetical protein Hanom_Chr16g01438741 [Helianthus anomalus]
MQVCIKLITPKSSSNSSPKKSLCESDLQSKAPSLEMQLQTDHTKLLHTPVTFFR